MVRIWLLSIRFSNAPWWPRLRGELHTKQAIKEMQLAAAARAINSAARKLSGRPRAEGDYELKEFDLMDLADLGGELQETETDDGPRRTGRRRSGRETYDPVYGGIVYEDGDDDEEGSSEGSDDERVGFSFSFGGGSKSKSQRNKRTLGNGGGRKKQSFMSGRSTTRRRDLNYDEGDESGGGSDTEGEIQWWWGKGQRKRKQGSHRGRTHPPDYDRREPYGDDVGDDGKVNDYYSSDGESHYDPQIDDYDDHSDDEKTHDARMHAHPPRPPIHDQELSDYEEQEMIVEGRRRDQRLWEREQQRRYAQEADARMQWHQHHEQHRKHRHHDDNGSGRGREQRSYQNYPQKSSSSNNERRNEEEDLASSAASSRFMHLMKFDEQTDVDILKNDCICQFWNKLDYRF